MNSSLNTLKSVLSAIRPVTSPLWRGFEIIAGIIDKSCQIFAVTILAGMWGLLMINAIARWWPEILPASSVGWSLEITKYMVAWSIFIIMGPVTRNNENIRVTFLPEKVLGEKKATSFIQIFENVFGLLLCIYLAKAAYDLVIFTHDQGTIEISSGGWEYPMWVIRSGILVGFITACIFYFERLVKWLVSFLTDMGILPAASSTAAGGNEANEAAPGTGAEANNRSRPTNDNAVNNYDNPTEEQT